MKGFPSTIWRAPSFLAIRVSSMETSYRAEAPDISIIICTRDRGDRLLPTVESALAALLASDKRLRYLREASVGLSAARNAGLRAARGALIAFTDDDCTVEPGWLAALKTAFETYPDAGLLFGHVACAGHDPTQGYLPGFKAAEGPLTRRRMFRGAGHWGMGANMALRRAVWERIGPFDEVLGAGALLKSGEDVDYVIRAVRQRIGVYHC